MGLVSEKNAWLDHGSNMPWLNMDTHAQYYVDLDTTKYSGNIMYITLTVSGVDLIELLVKVKGSAQFSKVEVSL